MFSGISFRVIKKVLVTLGEELEFVRAFMLYDGNPVCEQAGYQYRCSG